VVTADTILLWDTATQNLVEEALKELGGG